MIAKTVTLQEANELLPLVREHFLRINALLAHVYYLHNKFQKKTVRRFVFDKRSTNLTIINKKIRNKKFKARVKEIDETEILIEKEIHDILKLGVIIKSIVPPHIDFLSTKNNEPILLCWHGGEAEIKHWHKLDDSPPFRHAIEKQRFGRHMVH